MKRATHRLRAGDWIRDGDEVRQVARVDLGPKPGTRVVMFMDRGEARVRAYDHEWSVCRPESRVL